MHCSFFICQEVVGVGVFLIVNWRLGPKGGKPWDAGAMLKGVLERLVLVTALVHDFPQMLIAFGAMKLGTRLHEEQGLEISNAFLLIGNLLSMLLAMIGAIIITKIWNA